MTAPYSNVNLKLKLTFLLVTRELIATILAP